MNFIKRWLQRWLVDLVLSDERLQGAQREGEKAQDEAVSLMKEWLFGQERG